ncbi:MAG TPA: lipopolysaccharide heptosyltransferase II, partial [Chromatiales bacterium]|nr:lipopolysaccharide heptosyltransferase II [Chromatiales bacterium]
MSGPRRYLVVGPAWVGDMVMAQSLFMTLKQQDPDCRIDVLAPDWSLPLLARMPEVNEAIALPVAHGELALAIRWRLGRQLRGRGYTQALVLPRSAKAALVPFLARVPLRTGYRGEMRYGLINDLRRLDRTVLVQTVQRMVALGLPPDAANPPEVPPPALTIDPGNQRQRIKQLGLAVEKPVIGLMPGAAYGPAKQWPLDRWRALAGSLLEEGFRVWIFGSEAERSLAATLREAGEGVIDLCGRTRLTDTVDLLAACRAAVSNDSGLLHVACATGIPVVGIYGSSTPAYTPPLSDRARIVYLGLECSPCFQRQCPLGHTRCLADIKVEQVRKALDAALGRAGSGQPHAED